MFRLVEKRSTWGLSRILEIFLKVLKFREGPLCRLDPIPPGKAIRDNTK